MLAETKKLSFLQYQFEWRLVFGEIELMIGQERVAQLRLLAPEKDSRAKEFARIANRVAAARRQFVTWPTQNLLLTLSLGNVRAQFEYTAITIGKMMRRESNKIIGPPRCHSASNAKLWRCLANRFFLAQMSRGVWKNEYRT